MQQMDQPALPWSRAMGGARNRSRSVGVTSDRANRLASGRTARHCRCGVRSQRRFQPP